MRIVIVTALWGRHDVTRIFWLGVERVRELWQREGLKVEVVAVGSSDETHESMAVQAGAHYLDYPDNSQLGAKWNAGFQAAKTLKPDYVMKLDSDDLLSNSCAAAYVPAFQQRLAYIGLRGCHFYELETGRAKRWDGYLHTARDGEPVGFGRAIHRAVLRLVDWSPWEPTLSRNLDGYLTRRLTALGVEPTLLDHRGLAIDIKSRTNLSSYDHIPAIPVHASGWEEELSAAEWQGLTEGLK